MKIATLLEIRNVDVSEMSITRLMWINLCLLEEAGQQLKRDARAVRAGGATDKWWKENMED